MANIMLARGANAMKKNLLAREAKMKREAYNSGYEIGREIERMTMVIALNEVYGFAGDRLLKLEPVMNKIFEEMKTDDPDLFATHLIRRAEQIKGVKVGDPSHA